MQANIDKEKGTLTITLPLNPQPVRSTSGKTLVVASSHGNKTTEAEVDGQRVVVGVNAYIYPTQR